MSWDALHRHLRIHVELEVENDVLAGTASADLVHVLDPRDPFGERSSLGEEFLGRPAIHQIVRGAGERLPAEVEDDERGQARREGVQEAEPEVTASLR
jgi:hypothetical protein